MKAVKVNSGSRSISRRANDFESFCLEIFTLVELEVKIGLEEIVSLIESEVIYENN